MPRICADRHRGYVHPSPVLETVLSTFLSRTRKCDEAARVYTRMFGSPLLQHSKTAARARASTSPERRGVHRNHTHLLDVHAAWTAQGPREESAQPYAQHNRR